MAGLAGLRLIRAVSRFVGLSLLAAVPACRPLPPARQAGPAKARTPALAAHRLFSVEGLSSPRGAADDVPQDIYFVSNAPGKALGRGNGGFISRVKPDGSLLQPRFIEGGRGGATLNSPAGLAISGPLLWVADIDALRAFDRRSGSPVRDVDAAPLGALDFLGLTAGPDGSIYAADAARQAGPDGSLLHTGPDRVFRVAGRLGAGIAFRGAQLGSAGAIAWDPFGKRLVTVPLEGRSVLGWTPGAREPEILGQAARGSNGVVVLDSARLLVSSAGDRTVYLYENGAATPLITGIEPPGGLAIDRPRKRLLIPIPSKDRLEIWQLEENANLTPGLPATPSP